mmetsp:Transcript_7723/g.12957  ORF Transcript_7723/g.12957 Transcript_7723/m.12957 type:complete len:100 (+) Transcript_7723:3-302(+)
MPLLLISLGLICTQLQFELVNNPLLIKPDQFPGTQRIFVSSDLGLQSQLDHDSDPEAMLANNDFGFFEDDEAGGVEGSGTEVRVEKSAKLDSKTMKELE